MNRVAVIECMVIWKEYGTVVICSLAKRRLGSVLCRLLRMNELEDSVWVFKY